MTLPLLLVAKKKQTIDEIWTHAHTSQTQKLEIEVAAVLNAGQTLDYSPIERSVETSTITCQR